MDEDAQQEAAARANPVTIELDFRQVHSDDDAWDEIDRKLGFNGFGRNLDAFVDVLRGGFGHFTVNEFAKLVVRGKQTAAAHCTKWGKIQKILDESVDGEYGEQVTAVEWRDDDDEDPRWLVELMDPRVRLLSIAPNQLSLKDP